MLTMARDLLMLNLRPRLMLTPTFSMEDTMDMLLDMLDTTDTPMLTTDLLTTESDLLMLSPRLMLTLTFSMVDMVMDMLLDMLDTMDTPMPMAMLTMASALLMLNPRLMLTPTFSMDAMDTPMPMAMPTGISYKHQSLILLQKMDKTTIN